MEPLHSRSSRPPATPWLGLLPLLILAPALGNQDPEPPAVETRALVAEAILEAAFPVTAEELLEDVATLASDELRGRRAGTEFELEAAEIIADRFEELGLEPGGEDGGWLQPFAFTRLFRVGEELQAEGVTSRNVLAWFPGTDEELAGEYLLVGAHYDHLGVSPEGEIYNGADDNASGVAGLLGLAKALVEAEPRPRRSVLLVAFGAEELGLRGASHYVEAPARPLEQLVAMINLDMIGREFFDKRGAALPKRLFGIQPGAGVGMTGGARCPELGAIAREVLAADELPCLAPEDFPDALRTMIEEATAGRSDDVPFAQAGVPTLFFSTSEHDDYHRPSDTLEKLDGEILRRVAQATWRCVLAIDALETRPSLSQD